MPKKQRVRTDAELNQYILDMERDAEKAAAFGMFSAQMRHSSFQNQGRRLESALASATSDDEKKKAMQKLEEHKNGNSPGTYVVGGF